MLSIVVPTLNNFKGCVETLESVRTKHRWEPIIFPQFRANRVISATWNEGIEIGLSRGSKYILIINDDILFARHTIDNMVEFFENAPEDILLVSACNDKGNIDATYGSPYGVFEMPKTEVDMNNYAEHPDFSNFLIDGRLFEYAGKFDENFIPAYY